MARGILGQHNLLMLTARHAEIIDAANFTTRNYPIVQGAVLLIAVTYVFINLTVDVFYKWLDLRIKLE